MPKTVYIVDDHPLYQKALLALVRDMDPEVIPITANSAEEGLLLLRKSALPNLILLDLGLPGVKGAEAVSAFRTACPLAVIVVVSASESRQEVMAAARAGANAVVSKGAKMEALRKIVEQAMSDTAPIHQWITLTDTAAMKADKLVSLTARQKEVLALLTQGHSNKEIAIRLDIAEITVKMHLSTVFRALGVVNRTQAVMMVRRLGLHHGFEGDSDSNPTDQDFSK